MFKLGLIFSYYLNKKIKVIITKTIIAQIDKFFKKVFNLELDWRKAGSTKINTPIIYKTGITLSITDYFFLKEKYNEKPIKPIITNPTKILKYPFKMRSIISTIRYYFNDPSRTYLRILTACSWFEHTAAAAASTSFKACWWSSFWITIIDLFKAAA